MMIDVNSIEELAKICFKNDVRTFILGGETVNFPGASLDFLILGLKEPKTKVLDSGRERVVLYYYNPKQNHIFVDVLKWNEWSGND